MYKRVNDLTYLDRVKLNKKHNKKSIMKTRLIEKHKLGKVKIELTFIIHEFNVCKSVYLINVLEIPRSILGELL